MKRVKLLRTAAGPHFSGSEGQIIVMADRHAQSLIDAGAAELLPEIYTAPVADPEGGFGENPEGASLEQDPDAAAGKPETAEAGARETGEAPHAGLAPGQRERHRPARSVQGQVDQLEAAVKAGGKCPVPACPKTVKTFTARGLGNHIRQAHKPEWANVLAARG